MHQSKNLLLATLIAFGALLSPIGHAEGMDFDLLKATPIGSWQVREDTSTDQKGRQTVTLLKSSMLGEEMRYDKQYFWLEMVINSFKVKRGKRKSNGDQVVMKTLISADTFGGDPANIMTNLRGLGEELIIQNGKEDPIIFRGAGGFFGSLMKSMGTEVHFDFTDLGTETVQVPAGEFEAKKIHGTGNTETKILFKKIKVESDSTAWMSTAVPFGMVKTEGQSITNGKTSTFSSVLIEYGSSGATTLITKPPKEMPKMPSFLGQ